MSLGPQNPTTTLTHLVDLLGHLLSRNHASNFSDLGPPPPPLKNRVKFHPDKCKVVTIKHRPSPLAMLPFFAYHIGENLFHYADSEKDLGVQINRSFNFNEQVEILLTKANQKNCILKRTCHFFTCKNRSRVLYLALT